MTKSKTPEWLMRFVVESNRIEGIHGSPSDADITGHETLLGLNTLTVSDIEAFVSLVAPGHVLRSKATMNVRVGNHIPPPGGMYVVGKIGNILHSVNLHKSPYLVHHEYETRPSFLAKMEARGYDLTTLKFTIQKKAAS